MKRLLILLLLAVPAFCQVVENCGSKLQQGQSVICVASGGTAPYTHSLVSGSAGSLVGATYTAPASITPAVTLNGCQLLPNNSIFHTKITNLPVASMSAIWLSNIDSNRLSWGSAIGPAFNVVNSSDSSTYVSIPMYFNYTTQANGNFLFPALQFRVSEQGAFQYENGSLNNVDNHYGVTYRDSCKRQEAYGLFTQGFVTTCTSLGQFCNSASGDIYDMESNQDPGYGTTAGSSKINPLEPTYDEIEAAAAGTITEFPHPLRLLLDAAFDHGAFQWPGQGASSGSASTSVTVTVSGCSVSGCTVTATSGVFHAGQGSSYSAVGTWPAGMTIYISGTSCASPTGTTIATLTSATVLSTSTNCGNATGVTLSQPATNWPPYGAWFRLKSATTYTFDSTCTTTRCQNLVTAALNTMKDYGLILDDVGTGWSLGGPWADIDLDVVNAGAELISITSAQNLPPRNNFDIVDPSGLQTDQAQDGGKSATWLEAKLNNTAGVSSTTIPVSGAAVICATDSTTPTPLKGCTSVALQGVAVGIVDSTGQDRPTEAIQAGAAPIQFTAFATGSSTTSTTCTISPSGGAYGTVTSGGLYTPASTTAVTMRTDTTLTCTSTADPTKSSTKALIILPVDGNGITHIGLGKLTCTTGTVSTSDGNTWWCDFYQGHPAMFPDLHSYPQGCGSGCTGANASTAPNLYNGETITTSSDSHMPIWTSTGVHRLAFFQVSNIPTAANISSFSLDVNGSSILGLTDQFIYNGGQHIVKEVDVSPNASNGFVNTVFRIEGINPVCTSGYSTTGCPTGQGQLYTISNGINAGAMQIGPASGTLGTGTAQGPGVWTGIH